MTTEDGNVQNIVKMQVIIDLIIDRYILPFTRYLNFIGDNNSLFSTTVLFLPNSKHVNHAQWETDRRTGTSCNADVVHEHCDEGRAKLKSKAFSLPVYCVVPPKTVFR